MDSYKKPCFDSSVFLGGLNGEICRRIKRGVVFEWLWKQAKTGAFPVYIASITLAEVYKTKRETPETTETTVLDEFLELIEEEFVTVVEVDRQIGLDAHTRCRKFSANKLWPNDAIHLACCVKRGL